MDSQLSICPPCITLAILLKMLATCLMTLSLSSISANNSLYSSAVEHSWLDFTFFSCGRNSGLVIKHFFVYLIRVVIEHERLLIALDGDGIFLTTVPPICHSHAALAHLSPLKIKKNTVYILIWKS